MSSVEYDFVSGCAGTGAGAGAGTGVGAGAGAGAGAGVDAGAGLGLVGSSGVGVGAGDGVQFTLLKIKTRIVVKTRNSLFTMVSFTVKTMLKHPLYTPQ